MLIISSMPTAGGLYYASAVLAPEGWGPFASWVRILIVTLRDPCADDDTGCWVVEFPRIYNRTL
jgi:hypothetical protein